MLAILCFTYATSEEVRLLFLSAGCGGQDFNWHNLVYLQEYVA